jgi:endonuclease YncB( thermonuclease family)
MRPPRLSALVLAFAAVLSAPAAAETFAGPVERVVDGDTLIVAGRTVRLWGVDAPELAQTCTGDATEPVWDCGRRSRLLLQALAGSGTVACTVRGGHRGRVVALCRTGGRDLGEAMVAAGMAIDEPAYSHGHYAAEEASARRARRGLWRGGFERPGDHRHAR